MTIVHNYNDWVEWSDDAGTVTRQAKGAAHPSSLHLQVTPDGLPTGTLCEFVLGATPDQAWGGNYRRWSFTALGSALGNVSGIYGEFGGSVDPTPFILNVGVENPPNTFVSYEYWRTLTGSNLGNTAFGVGATTPRKVLQLDVANVGQSGTRDSHWLRIRGKANDGTTERGVSFDQRTRVTTTAGAGAWVIEYQRGQDTAVEVLRVASNGVMTVPTDIVVGTMSLLTKIAELEARLTALGG